MATIGDGLPAALPQHTWLPDNRSGLMPQNSTDSQDSVMSQIPLPYHIPVSAEYQNFPTAPPQSPAHLYRAPPIHQASGYSSQLPHNISSIIPASGYTTQGQDVPSYQNAFTMSSGGYAAHAPQPHMAQAYRVSAPQYGSNYCGTQPMYLGDQGPPQMMVYQQGIPQYLQQQQPLPNLYGYQQIDADPQYQEPYMSKVASGNSLNGPDYLPSRFETRGAQMNQPYASTGFATGGVGRQSYNSSSLGARCNSEVDPNTSSGYNGGGRSQNLSYRPQKLAAQSQQQIPQNNQPYVPLAVDINCRQRGFSVVTSPIETVGPTDLDKDLAPAATIPLVNTPKGKTVQTPLRKPVGKTAVHSPPATAPPLGQMTPILRSRKGQSVSKIRIDPILGPPPAFRPGGESQANPATGSTSVAAVPKTREKASSFGAAGMCDDQDPFTSGQTITGPQAMQVFAPKPPPISRALVPKNPFGAITAFSSSMRAPLVLPRQLVRGPSRHLAQICPNGAKPSLDIAFDRQNLPFMEIAKRAGPVCHGVVRISNIPYSIRREEIVAFFGRNARMVNEADEPIHIIMERVTGKTMEAYIEFINIEEAVNAVNRYDTNRSGGRGGRLGERIVDLEITGQEQLMADVFPKARNVRWNGAKPEIIERDPNDQFNSGFKGFVSREELVMLVKHVESPQRSPFSRECLQRPFECLITTLVKYPWYLVEHIILEDRDLLFDATRNLTKLLFDRVQDGPADISVDFRLLRRLARAAFKCAGFTESQKDDIALICGIDAHVAGLAPYAEHWHAFKTLGPKTGIEGDVLMYYIALIREATTSSALVTLAERFAKESSKIPSAFGNMVIEYPANVRQLSFAQIAHIEWGVIEELLRKVLQE